MSRRPAPDPPPPRPGRTALTALVVALVVSLLTACTSTDPDTTATAPTTVPLAPTRWTPLPVPPASAAARLQQAAVWTGTQAVVLGGVPSDPGCTTTPAGSTSTADGAAYTPATGTWQALPPSPLSARAAPQVQWTGTQLLVVAGSEDVPATGGAGCTLHPLLDGAAYTPATATWTTIAPAPLPPTADVVASAWTGAELLVWAGRDGGAAYDPAEATWRVLPAAPLPATGIPSRADAPGSDQPVPQADHQVTASSAWTGTQWLMWAAVSDADYHQVPWSLAYTPPPVTSSSTADGQGGTWAPVADGPAPQSSSPRYWDGQQVLALDFHTGEQPRSGAAAAVTTVDAYDPGTGVWTRGPDAPEALHPYYMGGGASVVVAGRLVTWAVGLDVPVHCPAAASCAVAQQQVAYAYDAGAPSGRRWQALAAGPWLGVRYPVVVATGAEVLVVRSGASGTQTGSSGPAAAVAGLLELPAAPTS